MLWTVREQAAVKVRKIMRLALNSTMPIVSALMSAVVARLADNDAIPHRIATVEFSVSDVMSVGDLTKMMSRSA
jgi:hypothetical protein